MLNSTVLEVAIGLVFCYAATALFVSSLNEAIASLLKLRGRTLLTAIKQLLNDPKFNGFAFKLYNHALINPLGNGQDAESKSPKVKPSYIPSKDFAAALIDELQKLPANAGTLKARVASIPDAQLAAVLTGFVERANGDVQLLQKQIADWFDGAMDRVSGAYKRRTQLMTFLLAFLFAIAFEVDSVHIFKALWTRPVLAAEITSSHSDMKVEEVNKILLALPLGLEGTFPQQLPAGCGEAGQPSCHPWTPSDYVQRYLPALPGLFITAMAALFGAPFWFDILQRLVQLRGTGAKPPTDKDKDKVTSAATR